MPTFPLTDTLGEDWFVEIDENTNTIVSVTPADEDSSSSSPSSQSSLQSESSSPSEQSSSASGVGQTIEYLQAVTGTQKTFNTAWTDVPEQSITPTADKNYLLLARNRANRDQTKIGIRVVEAAPFDQSELSCDVMSSDNSTTYGFFSKVFSSGLPIKKQFHISDPTYRVRTHTNRLAALDLSLLTADSDYWSRTNSAIVSLNTNWQVGAEAFLSVNEPGPYLILACNQTETTIGGVDILDRLTLNGIEVLRWKQESRLDDIRKPVALWWEDLPVGLNTISLESSAAAAAHTRTFSSLFALRLKAFASYAVDKFIPEVNLDVGTQGDPESEYPTVLNSLSFTMPNAGPALIMSGTIEDGTQLGRNRIEVDGAGVVTDSEGTCVRWDGDDEQPNWLFHIMDLSAGTHLIDQTAGDTPPNPSNNKCEDSVLIAFSLELAG